VRSSRRRERDGWHRARGAAIIRPVPEDLDRFLVSLRADAGGVLVPVRAQPRARRDGLMGLRHGALRVGTTSAPEDGLATQSIGRCLADSLGVPRSAVSCVVGPQHRDKLYRISGLTTTQAGARLREALG
jgi:uncharacterized protein YggU (UPF0235/DUF167 family)